MAEPPRDDGTAQSNYMADLALNLADQLISAFQQEADGACGGTREAMQDDEALLRDNGANDIETEAKDGNDEWEELVEEDEEGYDNCVKEEGVGEENPEGCFSPLQNNDLVHDAIDMDSQGQSDVESVGVMFAPARVLNFDDSDGDDLPALDQRFIPRGFCIESDFTDDRPELHGSEEANYFSGRPNMLLTDHSQNVRIIEGHDDLDLDRGAGYMSLSMRNNFLQTQMVQLPPLSADDHNASAHLYDSLEREEVDYYPENDDQDHQDDEDNARISGRDGVSGESHFDPKDAGALPHIDHVDQEESLAAAGGWKAQSQPKSLERDDEDHGDIYEEGAGAVMRSSPRVDNNCNTQDRVEQESLRTDCHSDAFLVSESQSMNDDIHGAIGGGPTIEVTLPKSSGSIKGKKQMMNSAVGNDTRTGNEEQPSARPKQPVNKRLPRGGPAGSNGREVHNVRNRPQPRVNLQPPDQRARLDNQARSRIGVGSSRHVGGGAQSQRPAVQGAAVTAASIIGGGDGDGAVAGVSSNFAVQGQVQGNPGAAGISVLSRTSSQGSIHSNNSNVSNSRVSGVGKESNNTRHNQPRPTRTYSAIPGSQDQSGIMRAVPPASQSQRLPQSHGVQQSGSQPPQAASIQSHKQTGGQPPASRPGPGGAGPRANARSSHSQLQQQHQQLQQEQQQLLQKQRHLQQQQQYQRQQQLQLGGIDSPDRSDGDHLVHHQPEAVVTQIGRMQQENHVQERARRMNPNSEVQGMEEVRSALQNMLRLPKDHSNFDQRGFDFADTASDLLLERPFHLQQETDASSLSGFRAHGQEDLTEMYEGFPSFSMKMFSEMSNMSSASDRSVHSEHLYLRENLEKERYRRKHCEQQIHSLNTKLLEVQQQLAVAVSTDKRKDIMIDQLDKQLAKVVEGWKKRETEKDEYIAMVMKEKSQLEETLQKQQDMVGSFEKELSSTVEELKQEKENSAELVEKMKAELSSAVHDQRHAEDMLMAEKERVELMEKEWNQLKESRDLAEKRAQQAQDRLHQEQDNWYQREQELVSKIEQVKEANLKVMQMERVKLEEQTRKAEDLEEKVHTSGTEVKRLEMEVDSAVREKESLKVEMALMEAKFESAQRSLEADLQAQMEKEVSRQVGDVQSRMQGEMEEVEEKHSQLVSELHQRHQQDMELQIASLRQDLSRREEDLKHQLAEMEARLSEFRQENISLRQAKQKLESQRLEVLNKLQFIMQSQWNEAVSLLVTTPQRKVLNTSLSSSQGPVGAGLQGPLGTSSSVGAPFSMLSGPASAAVTSSLSASSLNAVPASHFEQRGPSEESACLNNLSGSQSSLSSPPSPAHQQSSTSVGAMERGQVDKEIAGQQNSFLGESGMSLQDLTSLLSEGRYLPPNVATNIHGVTHHGGMVVQRHHSREDGSHQPHPHAQTTGQLVKQPSSSKPQAVMIRPPQQLSHPAGSSHNDISFMSTVSHDARSVTSQYSGGQWGDQLLERDREVESATSHHGGRRQPDFSTDRGLQLQDLQVDSLAHHIREEALMVSSGLSDSRGVANATSGSAYSPSMSPPVKQGRDGEQDSVDGGVLQETDRLNSSYREISRQLEEHQCRQKELQHYIKLLLDKPPQSSCQQPERDSVTDPDAMDISFSSIAVDLGLTDAAQAAQMSTELQRLQQLRDRQMPPPSVSQAARPKSAGRKPNSARNAGQAQMSRSGTASVNPSNTAALQPHQLAEISRLLGQYSEDVEASNNAAALNALQADPSSMGQIVRFLASLPQQPSEEGEKSSSTKSSPRQQHSRRTRDQHRSKKQADVRHHSVGPETSITSSVSVPTDKPERTMTASTRSAGSSTRKVEKKSANIQPAASSTSTAKQGARPVSKEQHPVWK